MVDSGFPGDAKCLQKLDCLWAAVCSRPTAGGLIEVCFGLPGEQSAQAQTVKRLPAAVESTYWRQRPERHAGVNAGGGDRLLALPAGQSSDTVPVGLPFRAWGTTRGRGGGRLIPGRKLGKMLRSPTSLKFPSLLDTHSSLPPHAFQPIAKSSHCHLKTLA